MIPFWYAVQIIGLPWLTPSVVSIVMSSGPVEPAGGDATNVLLGKVLGPLALFGEKEIPATLGKIERQAEEVRRRMNREARPIPLR